MSVTYADYIATPTNNLLSSSTLLQSTQQTKEPGAPAFANVLQNTLMSASYPAYSVQNSAPSFQVTLNALGFAPGTGYATAGATSGLRMDSASFYSSPSSITGGYGSDLSNLNIEWPRGQDVSGWEETVHISNVRISGGKISWDESGDRNSWPIGGEGNCNANAWIIQQQPNGAYKASTWEYVRKGQTTKLTENLEGTDVISNPPKSGDRVGIMIAGITRNPRMRNVEARSNVVWVTWP